MSDSQAGHQPMLRIAQLYDGRTAVFRRVPIAEVMQSEHNGYRFNHIAGQMARAACGIGGCTTRLQRNSPPTNSPDSWALVLSNLEQII